jgi:hypothetical protein
MPRFRKADLFGVGVRSVSPNITAQRRVNYYYDIRQDGDKDQIVLIYTPGLTLQLTLPTNPIRGMVQDGTYAYVVAGSTLYLLSPNGGYCTLGTISTVTATPVSMAFNETQLCIVDGRYGYVLNNLPGLVQLASNFGYVQQAQLLADFQFLYDIQNANIP